MATMSQDERGLLRYICDHPDDDLPRLIYADWLEETGDPVRIGRAHFIRLQCEGSAFRGDPETREAVRRTRRLLKQSSSRVGHDGGSWRDSLPTYRGIAYTGEYVRGFPRGVSASSAVEFVVAAPELLTTIPIHSLRLRRIADPQAEELAACPELLRIRELNFSQSEWDNSTLRILAGSPYLGGVSGLLLRGCSVSLAVLGELFAAKDFRPETLDLSDIPLGPGLANLLAARPAMERLRHLVLSNTQLGAAGFEQLAVATRSADFETVDSSRNGVGDDGAAALARVRPWPSLTRIVLAHNAVTDTGGDALLRSMPQRSTLVRVVLRNNDLSDAHKDRWRSALGEWADV